MRLVVCVWMMADNKSVFIVPPIGNRILLHVLLTVRVTGRCSDPIYIYCLWKTNFLIHYKLQIGPMDWEVSNSDLILWYFKIILGNDWNRLQGIKPVVGRVVQILGFCGPDTFVKAVISGFRLFKFKTCYIRSYGRHHSHDIHDTHMLLYLPHYE